MVYLLLGYLSFQLTLMYSALTHAGLLEWWGYRVGWSFAAVSAVMLVMFIISKIIKRIDLVDAAWGLMFIAAAVTSYLLQYGAVSQFDTQLVATLLVVIWGLRLSYHMTRRVASTDSVDPRYVELASKWRGNRTLNEFVRIYLVQAVLALIIVMPVIHINLFADAFVKTTWNYWTLAGTVVWLAGFIFESIADGQLRRFVRRSENRGRIMDRGLWRYSRHPNYFGELTQWWGLFIICLGVPVGWFGLIGPVVLTYLILFVSGIPVTEKRFVGRKGWEEYKASTSVIIPLPHRQ